MTPEKATQDDLSASWDELLVDAVSTKYERLHEELNDQWRVRIELDDARDERKEK